MSTQSDNLTTKNKFNAPSRPISSQTLPCPPTDNPTKPSTPSKRTLKSAPLSGRSRRPNTNISPSRPQNNTASTLAAWNTVNSTATRLQKHEAVPSRGSPTPPPTSITPPLFQKEVDAKSVSTTSTQRKNAEIRLRSQIISAIAEGDINYKKHNWNKSLEAYSKALELESNAKHILIARSKCFVQLGKFDEALRDVDKCLECDPNNYKAILQKANVLYAMGSFEFALMYYYKGYSLRKDLPHFTAGIRKAKTAINESVEQGSINPQVSASLCMSKKQCDASNPFTQRSTNLSQSSSYFTYGNEPAHENQSPRERKVVLKGKSLLGELYKDEQFLYHLLSDDSLSKDIIGRKKDSDIPKIVNNTLKFLNSRKTFWRQQALMMSQKPNNWAMPTPSQISSRPEKTKIIPTYSPSIYFKAPFNASIRPKSASASLNRSRRISQFSFIKTYNS